MVRVGKSETDKLMAGQQVYFASVSASPCDGPVSQGKELATPCKMVQWFSCPSCRVKWKEVAHQRQKTRLTLFVFLIEAVSHSCMIGETIPSTAFSIKDGKVTLAEF